MMSNVICMFDYDYISLFDYGRVVNVKCWSIFSDISAVFMYVCTYIILRCADMINLYGGSVLSCVQITYNIYW